MMDFDDQEDLTQRARRAHVKDMAELAGVDLSAAGHYRLASYWRDRGDHEMADRLERVGRRQ